MARIHDAIEVLRRRADFVAASRSGVKIGGPIVAMQLNDRGSADDAPRLGFTVTKRVGGAVERNRMKRRLRAAAREILPVAARPGCDYVVIARRAVLDVGFARLKRELAEAARRANGRAKRATPEPAAERPESGR